ncbi:helix-turn-helix transcriptional regulator [Halobacillus kuroshimensis]|uniref:Helix-turn-helix transcriptional regulator n=1 Tax=Halobacillus kuroshimensis TaxID=302481 RepID=A0ABS3E0Q1_9BACI|nr:MULTISPECIES: helix-turn-helix domain-containing protein [Halobacillus]MBN8237172.1 helix-turn-helix transcriptional regulator [Halobacillus kuroshimensis]
MEKALYLNEFDATLQIIQGKWKVLILYEIHESGCRRFGDLKQYIQDVSHKTLTRQLRELEQDGLLSRKVYPEVPPKVEYSLTERGRSLIPVLDLICDWGLQNVPKTQLQRVLCEED